MTHEEIRAGLMGALEGTLDPQEADEVERHVSACAGCRLEQAEIHRMHRSLEWRDRQEDARLQAPSGRRSMIPSGGWVRLALLAAAALVFSTVFHRLRRAPPAVSQEDGIVTVEMRPDPAR